MKRKDGYDQKTMEVLRACSFPPQKGRGMKLPVCRLLPMLLVVASLAPLAHADTAWQAGVYSGSWTNAANWTGGVPDASTIATLSNGGGDYTITIESDTTLYATNTTIGNTDGTTTVYVNSPITFFPGSGKVSSQTVFFKQNKGVKTVVQSGGSITLDGPAADVGRFDVYNSEFVLDGGTFDHDGGGMFRMSGSAEAPATFTIKNGGSFDYYHDSAIDYSFSMGANTYLNVQDGTFRVATGNNQWYSSPFTLNGGEVAVSGTGVMDVQTKKDDYSTMALNYGSVSFVDNSILKCSALLLAPSADSQTISVSFSGSSTMTNLSAQGSQTLIGDSHGYSLLDWNTSAHMDYSVMRNLYIGFNRGVGELKVRNGQLNVGSYNGIYVGVAQTREDRDVFSYRCWAGVDTRVNDPAQFAPTGIIRVAGGVLYRNTLFTNDGYGIKRLTGMMIGDGSAHYDEYTGRPCYGLLELSAGSVTNDQGHIAIGYGHAVGRVVQTGGAFVKGPGGSWTSPFSTVIGLAGGDGSYVLSNGVYTSNSRIFVGGASFDDLDSPASGIMTAGNYPKDARDAKGVLTLACNDKSKPCSISVSRMDTGSITDIQGVWVGRDGDGTLEIIGSGSTLDVKYTGLTLTNGFSAVYGEKKSDGTDSESGEVLTHGQATLRYVFDEQGVGLVDAQYAKVNIAPNAKLEVDMSAYTGETKTVTLLKRKNSTGGSFASENMTLKNCVIVQDETAIKATYRSSRKFIIMVR